MNKNKALNYKQLNEKDNFVNCLKEVIGVDSTVQQFNSSTIQQFNSSTTLHPPFSHSQKFILSCTFRYPNLKTIFSSMRGTYTVLYGDVVNFSQIADSNRSNAEEIKHRHKTIIHSLVEKYDGMLLDLFTDSSKILFENPKNAVHYTLELFRKLSLEPRIPYRIAINYGQVDYDDEGLYGEPAKIAGQLIRICTEGAAIMTTEALNVFQDIPEMKSRHIGNTLLKGSSTPVEIFCLANEGFYIPAQMELSDKSRNKKSIAILPFQNTSSESELDYICDGLAEDVIDRLTKAPDMFVTARSSSFIFRQREQSILEISRKLNVNYIFDGSIRKRGNQYRIYYQLVDSTTGYNIVSDAINSDFDDLYNAEKTIVSKLLNYFEPDTRDTLEEVGDYYINPVAYSHYLKGRHLAYQWSPEQATKAIEEFNKALEIVPDYALAYAGMSICHTHMAINGFMEYRAAMEKAVYYANLSIQADDTIHDGFVSKALATFWSGNWYVPDLEENIHKAMAISPCNAELRMYNGMVHLFNGDLDGAVIELKLANKLDPYSIAVTVRLGLVQYLNREYEDAYNTFLSIQKVKNWETYTMLRLAWCCIQMQQYDRALQYLDEVKPDVDFHNTALAAYLAIYFNRKNEEEYFRCKDKIEKLPETDSSYYYNLAVLNKFSGNYEKSIAYLEKTLQNKLTLFMFFHIDEFWKELHGLPEFQSMIEKAYNTKKFKPFKIESETSEFIELTTSEFIFAEAQDNYTRIVFKKDKQKGEKILRATLSHIEKQLDIPEIVRCHRSYLVNIKSGFIFRKNENKAILKNNDLDISIPVSRANEKDLRALLKK